MNVNYKFCNLNDIFFAEFDDTPNILWRVMSYRVEDAMEWELVINDILFIQNSLNEFITDVNGYYYRGKTDRLEQKEIEKYKLWVDSSVCNSLNNTFIYSNKDYTKIAYEYNGEKVIYYISTISFLNLLIKWRDFLLSKKIKEEGEINIIFMDIHNAPLIPI